ncbi:intermediate filament tail domain protein [Cooperia oncophora]
MTNRINAQHLEKNYLETGMVFSDEWIGLTCSCVFEKPEQCDSTLELAQVPKTDPDNKSDEAQNRRRAENHEIGTLNERLADVISNVHFLQAHSRKLEMIISQWSSSSWRFDEDDFTFYPKSGFKAEAEQVQGLMLKLSAAESRFEAVHREYEQGQQNLDDLVRKLCESRMKACIAKNLGRNLEIECSRLRSENQEILEDLAAQRSITDREVVDRAAFERRAAVLLVDCTKILESCRTGVISTYSFHDIEDDRRVFRAEIASAMTDIRRQYEGLASTVTYEMRQWYDERVSHYAIGTSSELTVQKEKLASLRAELKDLRTRLHDLDNRNRLLESLIADIEEAKVAERMAEESFLREDQLNLKALMEKYDTVTSTAPLEQRYTILTLRNEILRYRELLDSLSTGTIRDGPGALAIHHSRTSSRDIARDVSVHRVHHTPTYETSHSREASYAQTGNSASTHVQNSNHSLKEYRIGGGATAQSQQIGSGISTAHSQTGSGAGQYSIQIGHGVVSQDFGSGVVHHERYGSLADSAPVVISKLDHMIKEVSDDLNTSRINTLEHDYHRSTQGNVAIAEVAEDGSYIVLENTSLDVDYDLGEWTLRSTSSTLKHVTFTFPRDFILTPQNTVKVSDTLDLFKSLTTPYRIP